MADESKKVPYAETPAGIERNLQWAEFRERLKTMTIPQSGPADEYTGHPRYDPPTGQKSWRKYG